MLAVERPRPLVRVKEVTTVAEGLERLHVALPERPRTPPARRADAAPSRPPSQTADAVPGRARASRSPAEGGGAVRAPAAAETAAETSAETSTEFAAFMRDATPALGRLALFLTGDVHRAEELVQQTLVRTFEAWPRARNGDPLAYARRILANQRIDTWRRRRREIITDPALVPDRGVPDGARERAERDQLVRALATLGARRRRVVVLRYLVGLSERDVATELGLPLGTVKSTAARGLAELRELLDRAPAHATSPEEPRHD